jgi:hypothetical protein
MDHQPVDLTGKPDISSLDGGSEETRTAHIGPDSGGVLAVWTIDIAG